MKTYLALFLILAQIAYSFPQYYCTAANSTYYRCLLNLIGSIHETNFDECQEIAVFDLGFEQEELQTLQNIQKVNVYPLDKTHPDMLTYFRDHGINCLGWFSWKPVAIKKALEMFPYVLWVDAGTELRNPVDFLFQYIQEHDYLLCTIGDHRDGRGKWIHPIRWGTTSFVKNQFGLEAPDKQWILEQEFVMGNFMGISRKGSVYFLNDLYEWTKDLRYYADDGTAAEGWGSARHDQLLLSILAYMRNLTIYIQDGIEGKPTLLQVGGQVVPFYINWWEKLLTSKTHIYNVRKNNQNNPYYRSKIRMKV